MKSKFSTLLTSLILATTLASCGNKSGGSSSTSHQNSNNSSAGNTGVSASSLVAKTNLLKWYNSTVEGGYPSSSSIQMFPSRQVFKTLKELSTSNSCNNQSLNLFGMNLGSVNLCFNTQTSGSGVDLPFEMVQLSISGTKKNNEALVEAMSGIVSPEDSDLVLVSLTQTQSSLQGGSIFIIQYTDADKKSVIYSIDTGLNSALNPVYHLDGVNGEISQLSHIYPSN
jgi:hypothetical protein